jgi:hypothetical protein
LKLAACLCNHTFTTRWASMDTFVGILATSYSMDGHGDLLS